MALTMDDVKKHARKVGINPLPKHKDKDALIHAIQLAEGHTDCFKKIPDCAVADCFWRGDCIGAK